MDLVPLDGFVLQETRRFTKKMHCLRCSREKWQNRSIEIQQQMQDNKNGLKALKKTNSL
jgi:cytochrome c-type biogenesis protein CcmH/NrfF